MRWYAYGKHRERNLRGQGERDEKRRQLALPPTNRSDDNGR